MLPVELTKIFEEYDYEDLKLCITKVEYDTDIFIVSVEIKSAGIADQNALDEKWVLSAVGHRSSRISFDYAANINMKEEHPLLWKYTDVQCELYFNGQCQDPANLFVDIYKIHYELFRSHIPFGTFLNSNHLTRLFQASNGLLASGPKKLLTIYADCLRQHGLDFSIIGERAPIYWNGEAFIPESPTFKILFMSETDTYIIAEEFLFLRQST